MTRISGLTTMPGFVELRSDLKSSGLLNIIRAYEGFDRAHNVSDLLFEPNWN
jgi:hypothetical protein